MIVSILVPFIAALLPLHEPVIYDDCNTPFTQAGPPQRIVSLAPNITEILFALGLGGGLARVTRYCDYPAQALQKEKIGGMVDPNLERIQAFRPDLIIGFRGNPLGILGKLRNLRFPVFVLDLGSSLDGLFQTIEKVGRVTRAAGPAAEGDSHL